MIRPDGYGKLLEGFHPRVQKRDEIAKDVTRYLIEVC